MSGAHYPHRSSPLKESTERVKIFPQKFFALKASFRARFAQKATFRARFALKASFRARFRRRVRFK